MEDHENQNIEAESVKAKDALEEDNDDSMMTVDEDLPLTTNIKKHQHHSSSINFTVNKAVIPTLEEAVLEPGLGHLPGVTSFAQSTYEQGVIKQIEKVIYQNKLFDSDSEEESNNNEELAKLIIDIEDDEDTDATLTDGEDVATELELQTDNEDLEIVKTGENEAKFKVKTGDSIDSENPNISEPEDDGLDENENDDDLKNDPTYKVDPSGEDSNLDTADGPDYQALNGDFFDDDVDRIEQAPETAELPPWSTDPGRRKRKWSSGILNIEKSGKSCSSSPSKTSSTTYDDGDKRLFRRRVAQYRLQLAEANLNELEYNRLTSVEGTDGKLKIPKRIWDRLFAHQQESLKWLWEHHQTGSGGIIGDEMGLGKTIQVIAFLVALKHTRFSPAPAVSASGQLAVPYRTLGPVLLVCPATVMSQWVAELHRWWPPFRVAVLHSTSTYGGTDKRKMIRDVFAAGLPPPTRKWGENGNEDNNGGSILITSYSSVSLYIDQLASYSWHYVILDEGHKIRNPEAQVTVHCKQFKTPHRLILSGSPMQNNLRELWCLFDFIYPLKLGTLRDFTADISEPIRRGGYVGATDLQIKVAYKCTVKLRAVIAPYLLRRTKEDVRLALNLPAKTEQVLFCRLTPLQRRLYEAYLGTDIVRKISRGDERVFAALINIRKICNHPFLFSKKAIANAASQSGSFSSPPRKLDNDDDPFDRDFFAQSGKMAVVHALLKLWSKQHHKVLFFTQSRQMLDIVERYVQLRSYSYLRMDGTTAMGARQRLIGQFNSDPDVFIFLLTTKVGGLGVNLTGANRVLIYDPDWNPANDVQARERCWRIGQQKDVIIYRLLSCGTVEEKIYHRQIYKQYLTSSILKDPNYRRFFKINDLKELFTLTDFNETAEMFSEAKRNWEPKKKEKVKGSYSKQKNLDQMIVRKDCRKLPKIKKVEAEKGNLTIDSPEKLPVTINEKSLTLSDQKKEELREKARLLSRKLAEKFDKKNKNNCEKVNSTLSSRRSSSSSDAPSTLKSKTKEGVKCEGKRIRELVARENYDSDNGGEEDEEESFRRKKKKQRKEEKRSKKDKKKEDYLLRGLLGDALESVLQHEKIENVKTPDHYYLEAEAEKIASEAIEKLQQQSSQINLDDSSETLDDGSTSSETLSSTSSTSVIRQVNTNALATFAASRNSTSKIVGFNFGNLNSSNSSSSLIALVKANVNRQNFCVVGETLTTSNSPSTSTSPFTLSKSLPQIPSNVIFPSTSSSSSKSSVSKKAPSRDQSFENCSPEQLLLKLRDFLRYRSKETPNRATTSEILTHFADRIPPQRCALFKSMLKRLCHRRQTQGGIVVWHLKAPFRDSTIAGDDIGHGSSDNSKIRTSNANSQTRRW